LVDGAYMNAYFGIAYPLMPEWTLGALSPPPSQAGDYVLVTLVPTGEITATIVMTAQDKFFAEKHLDAAAEVGDFRRALSQTAGMTIDRDPAEVRIAGQTFQRVDFSGVGLHRAMLVTELRCHLVRFNLTAREPDTLASIVRSLENLSVTAGSGAAPPEPLCLKDYAASDTLVQKMSPLPVGPAFMPIPVRIIISADGAVEQVHVIRATADQRTSIENALYQWKFRPHVVKGRAVEVETGLLLQFMPR
jgi:hypothetical protein